MIHETKMKTDDGFFTMFALIELNTLVSGYLDVYTIYCVGIFSLIDELITSDVRVLSEKYIIQNEMSIVEIDRKNSKIESFFLWFAKITFGEYFVLLKFES